MATRQKKTAESSTTLRALDLYFYKQRRRSRLDNRRSAPWHNIAAEQRRCENGALSRGTWSCREIVELGHREQVPGNTLLVATATKRHTPTPWRFSAQRLHQTPTRSSTLRLA